MLHACCIECDPSIRHYPDPLAGTTIFLPDWGRKGAAAERCRLDAVKQQVYSVRAVAEHEASEDSPFAALRVGRRWSCHGHHVPAKQVPSLDA
jgi:hypothetical protein